MTEFRLLHCLMSHAGTVVPTGTLLKQVWGYHDPGGSDVVRVTVHRLRRKLEEDPARPSLLHTIPGVGCCSSPTPPNGLGLRRNELSAQPTLNTGRL